MVRYSEELPFLAALSILKLTSHLPGKDIICSKSFFCPKPCLWRSHQSGGTMFACAQTPKISAAVERGQRCIPYPYIASLQYHHIYNILLFWAANPPPFQKKSIKEKMFVIPYPYIVITSTTFCITSVDTHSITLNTIQYFTKKNTIRIYRSQYCDWFRKNH